MSTPTFNRPPGGGFRPAGARPQGPRPPFKKPTNNNGNRREEEKAHEGPRINEMIRVPQVRVINEAGDMLGVMAPAEAIKLAEAAGLDLVEVSPNAAPPVCKILDFGKYRYELQKKAKEAKKKQKVIEIKEIKLRPGIDTKDYNLKLRNVLRFLEEGDKVKITLRFRGREMSHMEIGMEVINRMKTDTAAHARVESEPKTEGRQMVMVLAPAKH